MDASLGEMSHERDAQRSLLRANNKFILMVSSEIFAFKREKPMSGRSTPAIPNLRVLVVDDDVLCLKIVTKMLQTCGYTGTFRVRIVARYRGKALSFFCLPPPPRERISQKKRERDLIFEKRCSRECRCHRMIRNSRASRVSDSCGRFRNLNGVFLCSRARGSRRCAIA